MSKTYKHKRTGIKAVQNIKKYLVGECSILIPAKLIENSEDWALEVERKFEILSFKNQRGDIFKQDSQIKAFCYVDGKAPFYHEEDLLEDKKAEIYSIRRLSDKEIFTVGDKVNKGTIEAITILSYKPSEVCFKVQETYPVNMHYVKHIKKVVDYDKKQYSLNDIKETIKKLGCFGSTLIDYLENEEIKKKTD